jgi:hypothetical protein
VTGRGPNGQARQTEQKAITNDERSIGAGAVERSRAGARAETLQECGTDHRIQRRTANRGALSECEPLAGGKIAAEKAESVQIYRGLDEGLGAVNEQGDEHGTKSAEKKDDDAGPDDTGSCPHRHPPSA